MRRYIKTGRREVNRERDPLPAIFGLSTDAETGVMTVSGNAVHTIPRKESSSS
jgi:hypothetical protein